MIPKSLYQNFFLNGTKQDNGCIFWNGVQQETGYGSYSYREKDGTQKMALAHRIAYSIVYGEIPEGKIIRHKCDNRLCYNVNHLELSSFKQNNIDTHAEKRAAKKNANHTKTYLLTNGTKTIEVNNLKAWCEERDFIYKTFYRSVVFKNLSHNGWTLTDSRR